jgi:acetyl-CoA C-acetyltransferase
MIIAGGMEHMTSAPYVIKSARWGQRLGNAEMIDTLVNDALWDMFYEIHIGKAAENACKQLIMKSKRSVKDLDLIEINEAFASQSIQVHARWGTPLAFGTWGIFS